MEKYQFRHILLLVSVLIVFAITGTPVFAANPANDPPAAAASGTS
ncbi:MAG: hypothetical protein U9N81_01425 [Bacillota bacterium]|nr:hypothetical protein [Bacillota bacterium]